MKYENQSLCSACGGYCCKQSPCSFMPKDFSDLSLEGLLKEFREKDYLTIVFNVFEVDIPYISMRAKHWKTTIRLIETRTQDSCVGLTSTGCMFSYDERPTGGKLVVPSTYHPYGCYLDLSSDTFSKAWAPYSEVLYQLMAHL